MRIVAWNCNMALDRKAEGLLALKPDIAVISECAEPERLRARGAGWMESDPVWIGRNPHKGLAVFGFNGHAVRLAESYHAALHYVAPVHVHGPTECNLLAATVDGQGEGRCRPRRELVQRGAQRACPGDRGCGSPAGGAPLQWRDHDARLRRRLLRRCRAPPAG